MGHGLARAPVPIWLVPVGLNCTSCETVTCNFPMCVRVPACSCSEVRSWVSVLVLTVLLETLEVMASPTETGSRLLGCEEPPQAWGDCRHAPCLSRTAMWLPWLMVQEPESCWGVCPVCPSVWCCCLFATQHLLPPRPQSWSQLIQAEWDRRALCPPQAAALRAAQLRPVAWRKCLPLRSELGAQGSPPASPQNLAWGGCTWEGFKLGAHMD